MHCGKKEDDDGKTKKRNVFTQSHENLAYFEQSNQMESQASSTPSQIFFETNTLSQSILFFTVHTLTKTHAEPLGGENVHMNKISKIHKLARLQI